MTVINIIRLGAEPLSEDESKWLAARKGLAERLLRTHDAQMARGWVRLLMETEFEARCKDRRLS